LTGSLTPHVDIAIICVSNIAMSTALQLAIELVEYEVTQQRRSYSSNAKDNLASGRLRKGKSLSAAAHWKQDWFAE
jgi:hypothetical protein